MSRVRLSGVLAKELNDRMSERFLFASIAGSTARVVRRVPNTLMSTMLFISLRSVWAKGTGISCERPTLLTGRCLSIKIKQQD